MSANYSMFLTSIWNECSVLSILSFYLSGGIKPLIQLCFSFLTSFMSSLLADLLFCWCFDNQSALISFPSFRPGLFAGSGYFPAPAPREGGHAALPTLREENGQTPVGGQRRQRCSERVLPACLQHAQMYDIHQNGFVFGNQIAPGEDWRMPTGRNNFDVSRAADLSHTPSRGPYLHNEWQWSGSMCQPQYSAVNCSINCRM